MSEQVNRRKSYRWTSAGQTSYDGADWDSSDDEPHAAPGKMALPALPPLDYAKDGQEDVQDVQEEVKQVREPVPLLEPARQPVRPAPASVDAPVSVDVPESITPARVTPTVTDSPSIAVDAPSGRTPRLGKNSQFTDGLDDLMVQISKEMTPKELQDATFGEAPVEQPEQGPEQEPASSGYFASMVGDETSGAETSDAEYDNAPDAEDDNTSGADASDAETPAAHSISSKTQVPGISAVQLGNHETSSSMQVYATPEGSVPADTHHDTETDRSSFFDGYGDSDAEATQQEVPRLQHSAKTDLSYVNSDDALSYTNSIAYEEEEGEGEDEGEENHNESVFHFHNKAQRESIIESSSDEDPGVSSDNLTMQVPQDGYFDRIVAEAERREGSDDILSIPESVESGQGESTERESHPEPGSDHDSVQIEREQPVDAEVVDTEISEHATIDGEESKRESIGEEESEHAPVDENESEHESVGKNTSSHESIGESEPAEKVTEEVTSTAETASQHSTNSHKSDEDEDGDNDNDNLDDLGKWKPDTDALRSGFVQETAKKAPPGYVYDESGNLVDLTPSGMKGRAVSTYSGVESGWNAFPAEETAGDGDLETIHDTKTLYDNSTIYNVPGLVGRNEKLPPLPSDVAVPQPVASAAATTTAAAAEPRPRSVSNATTNSERRPDVVGIQEPDSLEIARLSHRTHAVPVLDLDALVRSKTSHEAKYAQLRDYQAELAAYDTGLQTWISYSLKASVKDKDFLFDEYKSSRHVREAYANAEDLAKKNTVINTVNTVNQNVSHLKKKVFSHTRNSMKPKMLFSSIGKKVL